MSDTEWSVTEEMEAVAIPGDPHHEDLHAWLIFVTEGYMPGHSGDQEFITALAIQSATNTGKLSHICTTYVVWILRGVRF